MPNDLKKGRGCYTRGVRHFSRRDYNFIRMFGTPLPGLQADVEFAINSTRAAWVCCDQPIFHSFV
jgi:hypothetical protein